MIPDLPKGVTLVTTSPGFGLAGDLTDRISRAGWRLLRCTAETAGDELSEADFLIAGLPPVTADSLAAAPRLRAVLKHGVGLDAIDMTGG
jgi:D-3-phosphoglycerate dehydrogenase